MLFTVELKAALIIIILFVFLFWPLGGSITRRKHNTDTLSPYEAGMAKCQQVVTYLYMTT